MKSQEVWLKPLSGGEGPASEGELFPSPCKEEQQKSNKDLGLLLSIYFLY